MEHCHQKSRRIMEILVSTGAVIEPMSIDEGFLDLSTMAMWNIPRRG
jgi:nucleotidyltransferase/DNA polymerase involved in DNA repair